MSEYYSLAVDGHVITVTLQQPEISNSLDSAACLALHELFDEFERNPQWWVAVITGAGERAFCAGMNLKNVAKGEPLRLPPSGFAGLTHRFDNSKPVIAAVNGAAYGGGLEMALACDIVIAAEHAIFALSEPRVGVAALAGGVHRLARQIGLKQAMGMLLNGRKVSAAEAHELGFVNEVVPAAELMATAQRWAAEIAACAPLAVRATKQLAMSGLDLPLREAMAASYPMVTAMLNSPDMVEGARAFAERRAPNWQG
ncbi:MAG TPA: enoyl-CoA hydratase-related protein [Pseudomonadales bacterium]|jgi:enoyl-CoA hydratase/carnithine racemase|nr:enoyl-CoA hydratase-related protein [Pseudomonadales bacterium]HNF73748.1 enoyl-CoA hydratase-related protein [Pseudomonadales bacterium]HNL30807.1 enoyl-CoA hydratase-related protein [Pseudomonadales bacterium]HNN37553.1 enoyl-CoA hydratase-related protein [Pseudomonadales bacterium]HQN42196.1 enoyl-CoA hydratase-related protein [Pseudomonadales bacterium]